MQTNIENAAHSDLMLIDLGKTEKPTAVADTGGGQTRPMPPLTNKDTPPVHCNEFNYMSSATHCRSSCRPRPVVRVKYHP